MYKFEKNPENFDETKCKILYTPQPKEDICPYPQLQKLNKLIENVKNGKKSLLL